MSSVSVDKQQAEKLFRDAHTIASADTYIPQSNFQDEISLVILGSHLTYRYILITALLSKATEPNVDALALQAKAPGQGAYDARSIAHDVLVPLERELLDKALGGSNEPYLNKPARFERLSLNNAVRRGQDKEKLETLVQFLPQIQTAEEAFQALCDAIYFIKQRRQQNMPSLLNLTGADKDGAVINPKLGVFVDEFLASSIEGETSALMTGTALSLLFKTLNNKKVRVIVHPVNQSGASSNEIADIDVRDSGKAVFSVEVKDKKFTSSDVGHAVSKAASASLKHLIFATGNRGTLTDSSMGELIDDAADKGVILTFVKVADFSKSLLAVCFNLEASTFISELGIHANAARVKDETRNHIRDVAKRVKWLT